MMMSFESTTTTITPSASEQALICPVVVEDSKSSSTTTTNGLNINNGWAVEIQVDRGAFLGDDDDEEEEDGKTNDGIVADSQTAAKSTATDSRLDAAIREKVDLNINKKLKHMSRSAKRDYLQSLDRVMSTQPPPQEVGRELTMQSSLRKERNLDDIPRMIQIRSRRRITSNGQSTLSKTKYNDAIIMMNEELEQPTTSTATTSIQQIMINDIAFEVLVVVETTTTTTMTTSSQSKNLWGQNHQDNDQDGIEIILKSSSPSKSSLSDASSSRRGQPTHDPEISKELQRRRRGASNEQATMELKSYWGAQTTKDALRRIIREGQLRVLNCGSR